MQIDARSMHSNTKVRNNHDSYARVMSRLDCALTHMYIAVSYVLYDPSPVLVSQRLLGFTSVYCAIMPLPASTLARYLRDILKAQYRINKTGTTSWRCAGCMDCCVLCCVLLCCAALRCCVCNAVHVLHALTTLSSFPTSRRHHHHPSPQHTLPRCDAPHHTHSHKTHTHPHMHSVLRSVRADCAHEHVWTCTCVYGVFHTVCQHHGEGE